MKGKKLYSSYQYIYMIIQLNLTIIVIWAIHTKRWPMCHSNYLFHPTKYGLKKERIILENLYIFIKKLWTQALWIKQGNSRELLWVFSLCHITH